MQRIYSQQDCKNTKSLLLSSEDKVNSKNTLAYIILDKMLNSG